MKRNKNKKGTPEEQQFNFVKEEMKRLQKIINNSKKQKEVKRAKELYNIIDLEGDNGKRRKKKK